ncbi:copper amine oxidase N-terminal domain-containing protein, partial [uncultured Fenollaria sp.]|uniref:copper amine oxidase N-terminal domain-containing protein n=1 Tax=uncultured Fenollaria sp. TaxID=1686315 RepID=UPI0025EF49AC
PNPNPNPNPDPGEPDRPYWPGDDYYRPHRPYWPEDDYYRPYRPYRPNNDDRRVAEEEEKPAEKTTMTEIKAIATIGSKELEILINGISSKKTMDVAAQINNGRTMLPLRFVAEALGFKVMWISETRTVVIYDDEFKVEIPVDSNLIIVNGVSYESDVKPQLVNNRTLLPIANIARALGLKDGTDILWNPTTRQATVIRRIYSK